MEKSEVVLVSQELWDDMQNKWSELNTKVDLLLEQRQESNKPFEDKYFSVKQAAEYLGCSEWSIHNYKSSGLLKFNRIGRSIRIKKSDLIKFLEGK